MTALGRDALDLRTPEACAAFIRKAAADVVINAAAFTAVDAAESVVNEAELVNAHAPAVIAQACHESGQLLLHVSTDYVFDGSGKSPWRPNDVTNPLNVYGRTKRAGEIGVLQGSPDAIVLRTSWVFSAHGRNFVRSMLRLAREHKALRVVDDQIGGPTPAAAIADALLTMARVRLAGEGASGVHHFAGTPAVSWASFASSIFECASLPVHVERIATAEYRTAAPRPLNSRLDCSTTNTLFGVTMPEWRLALAEVIRELSASSDE